MERPPRVAVSAALFVALGLVGAFIVSAVADALDDGGPSGEPQGLEVPAPPPLNPADVRVEVLNGAGKAGLARDATHALRSDGFDVVFFGNAGHFDHARSVVIDRMGQPDLARAVAASLRVDSITTAVDSSLMLEVTVVLGADWPPPQAPPDGALTDRLQGLHLHDLRLRDLLGRDSQPAESAESAESTNDADG